MMMTYNVFERERKRYGLTDRQRQRQRQRERGETPCTVWHPRLMQEAVQTVFQVDKNAVMFSGKVNDPLTFKNGEK